MKWLVFLMLLPAVVSGQYDHTLDDVTLDDQGNLVLSVRALTGANPTVTTATVTITLRAQEAINFGINLVPGVSGHGLVPGGYFPEAILGVDPYPRIGITNRTPDGGDTIGDFAFVIGNGDVSRYTPTVEIAYRFRAPGQGKSKWFYTTVARPAFTPGEFLDRTLECTGVNWVLHNPKAGFYSVLFEYFENDTINDWVIMTHVFGSDWTDYADGAFFIGNQDITTFATDGRTRVTYRFREQGAGGTGAITTGGPFTGPDILGGCP